MVNSNVRWLKQSYVDFRTETNWDFLKLAYSGGDLTLTGNLGTGWVLTAPILTGPQAPRYRVTWHSDGSINYLGIPRISKINATCLVERQPTFNRGYVPINERIDGILIDSGDVIYVNTLQLPNTRLMVSVTVPAANTSSADFDLYASTSTALPDNSSYTWRDTAANLSGTLDGAGASVVIPSSPVARAIYLGIRSYSGAGHFVLRADNAKVGVMTPSLTVCTPGVNMAISLNQNKVIDTLKKSLLRLEHMSHGNYQPTKITFKNIPDYCSQFCTSDSSCDICMTTPCAGDYCTVGQTSGTVVRVAYHSCANYNSPDSASLVIAHELGHSRFGLANEYNPDGPGSWFCGHSVMNGPNSNSDKWCVGLNHCQEWGASTNGPLPGYDCSASGTNWARAPAHYPGQFVATPPNQDTQSSQPGRVFYRNTRNASTLGTAFQ